MESFAIGFFAGAVIASAALRIALHIATKRAEAQLETLMSAIKTVSDKHIAARVEQHDGVFYVYRVDDNTFLAQGNSLTELKQRIEDRIKDARVFVTEGDPEVMSALKATTNA